jgi:carbamoyltransferase
MNVVGISAFNHDSACCLLQDGKLTAAVEEERFSRIKHDPRLPRQSFLYCLAQGGLTLADIDSIGYYEDSVSKLSRQLWSAIEYPRVRARLSLDPRSPVKQIRDALGFEKEIVSFAHHESHAAAAKLISGFRDPAILVADGVGEWATTSYWVATPNGLNCLGQVEFPHSLGLLYSTVTGFLGFNVNGDEYKVMGLAPYGKPTLKGQLTYMVADSRAATFRLDMEYFDFLGGERMFSRSLTDLIGFQPRSPEQPIESHHRDLAASIQALLEEAMLAQVEHLATVTNASDLCVTGGVALNCVANEKIRKSGLFKRCFFQPASGDSGSAIGAAYLAHIKQSATPIMTPTDLFLGPDFTQSDVESLLAALGITYSRLGVHEKYAMAAKMLADGKIIGWFQGRAEFGPRALGARSILADARRADARDVVNRVVKQRESFRPFAPVVLQADVDRYFDGSDDSPYMTETCRALSPESLPATTHIDGSARYQTIADSAIDHPLSGLLRTFRELTGCSVLLNTSFNLRGEPIVGTPEDALRTFVHSGLDALFVNDCLVIRDGLPKSLHHCIKPGFAEDDPDARSTVYTFF